MEDLETGFMILRDTKASTNTEIDDFRPWYLGICECLFVFIRNCKNEAETLVRRFLTG